jgi:hypothetical protein
MVLAYFFEDNPSKIIAIGLTQIVGGTIAGGLTLLGVKFTIYDQESKFELLQKREVMPLLTGNISNTCGEEISKSYTFFTVNKDENVDLPLNLYITNVGKGYAKITKINDGNREYQEMNQIKPFIAPNKTIKIMLYLVNGSNINGNIIFMDIYENEYNAVYNYQSNSITTIVNGVGKNVNRLL